MTTTTTSSSFDVAAPESSEKHSGSRGRWRTHALVKRSPRYWPGSTTIRPIIRPTSFR